MIALKKLVTPSGITVFHQLMPDIVRSVNISWLIFTGAADDESVGAPGLYHWFEHVPFRGTVKYPDGKNDIRGRFTRCGGSLNAWTSHLATCYEAFVPVSVWKDALAVVTDLFAQPLITPESVEAERRIIHQEIARSKSKAQSVAMQRLHNMIYAGHSLGHDVLGTEDTLASMDPKILRKAHELGYDRSRCVLFVAGNVSQDELIEEIERLQGSLPNRGLPARFGPTYFGPVSWMQRAVTEEETEFGMSVSLVLFPLTGSDMLENFYTNLVLAILFGYGSDSPLNEIVREQRQLVYSTYPIARTLPGMACFGFGAESKRDNIEKIIQAFRDVIKATREMSTSRFEDVRRGFLAEMEMQPISPDNDVGGSIQRLMMSGTIISDNDLKRKLLSFTREDVDRAMSVLDPDLAITVIFKGMGREK